MYFLNDFEMVPVAPIITGITLIIIIIISIIIYIIPDKYGDRGGTVLKVLCYKSEGRWFDSRWCHWNFSLTSFRSHYGPGGRLSL